MTAEKSSEKGFLEKAFRFATVGIVLGMVTCGAAHAASNMIALTTGFSPIDVVANALGGGTHVPSYA